MLYCLSPSLHLRPHGSSWWSIHRGREDLCLVYRWFYIKHGCCLKVTSDSTTACLWNTPKKTVVKGNLAGSQKFGHRTWLWTLLRRNGPIWYTNSWAADNNSELGKNMTRKLMTNLEEVYQQTSLNGQKVMCVSCEFWKWPQQRKILIKWLVFTEWVILPVFFPNYLFPQWSHFKKWSWWQR